MAVEQRFTGPWQLYDYLDSDGNNVIKIWADKELQSRDRGKLSRKLDMLEQNGPNLSTDLLSDTHIRTIKKLRINGEVAIRLMLCRGPIDHQGEFTLLFGAKEQNRKLVPRDAEQRAEDNRQEIINNPLRRCIHE